MALPGPIKQIWKSITGTKCFDQVLKKVDIISAGEGKCKAAMTVSEEHANMGGTLHGGLTSTIVDVISGLALTTHRQGTVGVSVDLHVRFLRGVPIGEEIVIEACTRKAGKTLAFLDVSIFNKAGDLVAQGSHTKYIGTK